MDERIHKAMKALNQYEYHMGSSTQEALWLIHQMKDIFENKEDIDLKEKGR
ncbi:hypothetical protein [Paenibacillus medicaginis]|uniref:Uncharacterized protein n=1 Tax=Paenibacillus medicaginis TaxID=1470560 RepID=A0ABV5BUP0_9BACL